MSSVEPSASAPTDSRLGPRTAVGCGAAALLAGVAYFNSLSNPFVYDDYHTVVDNPSIRQLADLRGLLLHDLTRPITNISYAIDYAFWRSGARGFHITNLLLHVLNVVLLYVFVQKSVSDRPDGERVSGPEGPSVAAFVAAAWLAVHPMMTESVGYISGRSEVLCATFFLLAMIAGRRWLTRGGAIPASLTVLAWAASMAAKETGAMFPFVFALYDWLAVGGAGLRRRAVRIHTPLAAVAIALGFLRMSLLASVEYPGQASLHWPYIWLALDVARRYTILLLVPAGQTIFHAVDAVPALASPRALASIAVLVTLTVLAWRVRSVAWISCFGLAWFLLLLVPGASLTMLDQGEPMAEHRVYLASCGLFIALGGGVAWGSAWLERHNPRLSWLPRAAVALVLISYAGLTITRNRIWASPVVLWGEAVDLAPEHFRPRLLLGEALEDVGRRDEAAEQYETAVKLQPSDPTGHLKLGQLLARRGLLREARDHVDLALASDPDNQTAHQMKAILDQIERERAAANR